MATRTIIPSETATLDLHQFLLGAVSPRPIAFVSTISEEGVPNLAPYSFFNAFSSRPPIVIFSSNRRVRTNTTKDTLANVKATGEVVINVVSHTIARQMTLTSIDYPEEVSEFVKAGLTPVPSDLVKPFRVKESPVQMECKVIEVKPLGTEGGAGNLVICEVIRMHIEEAILDDNDRIDPHKIDLVGRMGRAFYTRASGEAVFPLIQPVNKLGIGFDQLPDAIKESKQLSGWHLAQLASVEALPDGETIARLSQEMVKDGTKDVETLHLLAAGLLDKGHIAEAGRPFNPDKLFCTFAPFQTLDQASTHVYMHATNDPSLKSWVEIPEGSDFPIQNLPFGIFQAEGQSPRAATAIGNYVIGPGRSV